MPAPLPTTPPHERPSACDGEARSCQGSSAQQTSEEREFEAFAQGQDPLDIAAATWATRKRSGLSTQDEAELQAWLDADPRHTQAFDDMNATLGDLQQLPADDVARLRTRLCEPDPAARMAPPHAAHRTDEPLHGPPPAHDGWITHLTRLPARLATPVATAAVVLALVGSGWAGWNHWQGQPVFEQAYATGRGQQIKASLPDSTDRPHGQGSTLQLDTATEAHAWLYRNRREVRVHSGQAMFAVHSDPQRPFHVYVGALRITVVGTRFAVRHTRSGLEAGQTLVAVEQGRVRVEPWPASADGTGTGQGEDRAPGPQGATALELTAGQMLVADAQGRIGPVTRTATNAIAPWRHGRLSFDQTPLAQAIAEFERYGLTGLVVRDPAVAALPVGGSYNLGQWQRFADTLPQVLPVRLVRRGKVTEVVARPVDGQDHRH